MKEIDRLKHELHNFTDLIEILSNEVARLQPNSGTYGNITHLHILYNLRDIMFVILNNNILIQTE